ncbi:hypothetical protein ACXWP2_09275, partial [Streptococcus pyogenes]
DTVYKAKSVPRKMPDWHFIQHKLTREDRSDAKNQKWHLTEHAIASGSALPKLPRSHGFPPAVATQDDGTLPMSCAQESGMDRHPTACAS